MDKILPEAKVCYDVDFRLQCYCAYVYQQLWTFFGIEIIGVLNLNLQFVNQLPLSLFSFS